MRNPLRTGNAVGEKIKDSGKARPQDTRHAHATGFVGGEKDGRLRGRPALRRGGDFGPFVNHLDFAVKQGTFRLRIGTRQGEIQIPVEDGGAKDLVAGGDTGGRDGQDLVFHHLENLRNLSHRSRQGRLLGGGVNHNSFCSAHVFLDNGFCLLLLLVRCGG